MSSVFFDRERIAQWLGDHTVAKARSVGAVTHVEWHGAVLSGDVQGTQARPYRTRVRFRTDGGSPWAQSDCTCPVGRDCKHVAALLLAELEYHDEMDHIIGADQEDQQNHEDSEAESRPARSKRSVAALYQPSGVRPELVSWLERFRARAEAADALARNSRAARAHTLAYRLNWSDFHKRHEVALY